jgi:hypothetical protein
MEENKHFDKWLILSSRISGTFKQHPICNTASVDTGMGEDRDEDNRRGATISNIWATFAYFQVV